jgi:uncharacterized coiled-coil DUF342 family protein
MVLALEQRIHELEAERAAFKAKNDILMAMTEGWPDRHDSLVAERDRAWAALEGCRQHYAEHLEQAQSDVRCLTHEIWDLEHHGYGYMAEHGLTKKLEQAKAVVHEWEQKIAALSPDAGQAMLEVVKTAVARNKARKAYDDYVTAAHKEGRTQDPEYKPETYHWQLMKADAALDKAIAALEASNP